jgi:hypothetical protein
MNSTSSALPASGVASETANQAARPKLLNQARIVLRSRYYSQRMKSGYLKWLKRFVLFHNKHHPAEIAETEVNPFRSNRFRTRIDFLRRRLMQSAQWTSSFTLVKIGDVNVAAFAMAVILLVLVASSAWAQRTAKVGGTVPYHSGNLLKNPDASSGSTAPWSSSLNWTINTGPATLGAFSIDSCDQSPWFLQLRGMQVTCSSCAWSNTPSSLVQTIDVSAYSNLIHAYSTYFEYGGDAFAEGVKVSGNGCPPMAYQTSTGYKATYRLDFYDKYGNNIGFDISGNIFPAPPPCLFASTPPQHICGYRRTVGALPNKTRSVRFTAAITDVTTVCCNYMTTSQFKNGFDNLWLDFIYLGAQTAHRGFHKGSAPRGAVKVKATRNRRR